MRYFLCISFAVILATLAGITSARQDTTTPNLPAWVRARLAALDPNLPMAYFELGEEVSYELPGPVGRDLARTLFVLAYHLDEKLGPHACLALADLTTAADERRWLLAMAESMGSKDAQPWGLRDDSSAADQARHRLAEGLRAIRAEDGRAMRDAMSAPSAREYLERLQQSEPRVYAQLLTASQAAEGRTGCPRCRNQRVITEGNDASRTKSICPRCGGNPGLALNEAETLASLRAEASLRRAEPATWSAIILMQQDRPIRDIRAGDLSRTYSVESEHTLWSETAGWHAPETPNAD